MVAVAALPPICYTLIVGYQLRKNYRLKARLNYPFVKGDILWNTKTTVIFPILSVVAGVAAGFLGIGSLSRDWRCILIVF